jgi:uncharacterized membrane protein YphA (DoxX/SURF4 family)
MLSSVFVFSGFRSLRNPDAAAPLAEAFLEKAKSVLPQPLSDLVPTDGATAVRINAAVHVVGGLMLSTGRMPRLSSLTLAASMVPTTFAGHAFWTYDDPAARSQHQTQFFKNLALMGGLLIAAVDTEGKPSVAWRTRAAAHQAGEAVASALPSGGESSETAALFEETIGNVAKAAKEHSAHLASVAKEQAPVVAEAAKEGGEAVMEAAREQAPVVAEAVQERAAKVGRRAAKQAAKAAKRAQAKVE